MNNLLDSKKIAIVVATFHSEVTTKLLQGAQQALIEHQISAHWLINVPGAVELPFAANRLAKQHQADAVIALGAVIFGETDHYHYVSQQASQGCQRVSLDYDIPVGFGVLTTQNKQLALARAGGSQGNAGYDAAMAVIEVLNTFASLKP